MPFRHKATRKKKHPQERLPNRKSPRNRPPDNNHPVFEYPVKSHPVFRLLEISQAVNEPTGQKDNRMKNFLNTNPRRLGVFLVIT